MFGMPATVRVFVAVPPADLRKGYDGLSQLARDAVKKDPLSGHLFVFANRKRDRINTLYWDRDGDAIWSIDNNATENAIRPIALGRKHRLRLGSDRGGQTAATLLSLVQSCKNPGNEPFAYLRDVLDRVSTHPASRIDDLLPDRRVWPPPLADRKG